MSSPSPSASPSPSPPPSPSSPTAPRATVRFVHFDELTAFRRAAAFGFGDEFDEDKAEARTELYKTLGVAPQTVVAEHRQRIVATLTSYDLDLTVPGGQRLATAGTSAVTVHPTHRRQGILTEMMDLHLAQARDRGQPLAALYASEETIYGRFGYGVASFFYHWRYSQHHVTMPPGHPEITLVPYNVEEARSVVPTIYARTLAHTVGSYTRSAPWWERILGDLAAKDHGDGSLRVVVAERHGHPTGYVLFRQNPRWEGGLPVGTVTVQEMAYADDDTRRRLVSFVSTIDLMTNVCWNAVPADMPSRLEVDHARRIHMERMDQLWVRVLDVPKALEGRRYESSGSIVLDVTDPQGYATGRHQLQVGDDGRATCTPVASGTIADVRLDVAELGSIYLGHPHVRLLARAGRLVGDQSAIGLLARLFETADAPFCAEMF